MANKKELVKQGLKKANENSKQDQKLIPDFEPDVIVVRSLSSVEISVDSKGQFKPTVKIYDEDPEIAADKAVKLVKEILDKLEG